MNGWLIAGAALWVVAGIVYYAVSNIGILLDQLTDMDAETPAEQVDRYGHDVLGIARKDDGR